MKPIDLNPHDLGIVLDVLRKHVPDREVLAFGSRATWTAKEFSDLDLAIMGDQPLSSTTLTALNDELDESDVPFKVDVVDWATTSEPFRDVIRRDGVHLTRSESTGARTRGEWRECALGDVIELKRGYDLPQQARRRGSVPIVSSSGVSGFHPEGKVKGPGVVTGRYGTLGQVFYIAEDFWPLNTTLYVRDFKGNAPRFISYLLRSVDFLAYSDKAAVPGLNRNHLHQARVRLPVRVEEQRAIAHILGTLDDKIELNRRMNETLEAMARAIFRSWFVDFDPVRAKAEGRLPAGRQATPALPARPGLPAGRHGKWFVYALECENGSVYIGHTEDVSRRYQEHVAGKGAEWTKRYPPRRVAYWEELSTREAAIEREKQLKTGSGREWLKCEIAKEQVRQAGGLPKAIADLFPDRFEDSELGEIPAGWRVGSIDEEFDLTMGQSPPGETYNEIGAGLPFYQGRADFTFRFPARRVYCTAPTRLAKAGDTLVSVRAPVGDINLAAEDCAIGRGVGAVRHRTGGRSYTYYSMRSLKDVFARFEAEGTVFGSISKRDFHKLRCIAPGWEMVHKFEHIVGPFDDRIERCERESRTLGSLRDRLLPKLISGEVRVPDAEAIAARYA